MIEEPITQIQDSDTTPSVLNSTRIQFTNSGAVSVTDLTDGQDGQMILILGDGNTTLVDNTRLELGANLLLAADKIYPFLYYSGKWYPLAVVSASAPTAGAGISVTGSTVANKYVGKAITIYGAEVVITTTGSTSPFPNNSRKSVAVIDTTAMGQYRISITGSSAGAGGYISPALSYSSNGSSWSEDSLLTAMEFNSSSPKTIVSAWDTLPAGAIGATIYVGIVYQCGVEDVTVFTVTLEFKP